MTGALLLINVALLLVYMSIWFVVARLRRRLDTVDMAWGGGFVVVAWATALVQPEVRTIVIAALVTVWGGRLFLHIARRAQKSAEDPRYTELTKKWHGNLWMRAYFSIFLTQDLLIAVVGLPIMFAAGESTAANWWLLWTGAVLWLAGFLFESIADHQLRQFIANPKNEGDVMRSGLWRFSRHPNYFGELTQWWAIGIIALGARVGWLGLAGPLTLTILIVFISGIPPIERRKRNDPKYRDYMRHTSPLVPLPPK